MIGAIVSRISSGALVLLSVAVLVPVGSSPAEACSSDTFIGSVCYTAANFCPQGYVQAAGQTLQIAQYQALYSLVGNTYGGTPGQNFVLPDLRGRTAVGTGQGPGLQNVALGTKRGQETVTLSAAQTPVVPHTHPATFSPVQKPLTVMIPLATGVGTMSSVTGGTVMLGGISVSGGSGPLTVTGPYVLNPTGGTASMVGTASGGVVGGTVTVASNAAVQAQSAVPTISPQLGLTACIASDGLYPTRP